MFIFRRITEEDNQLKLKTGIDEKWGKYCFVSKIIEYYPKKD